MTVLITLTIAGADSGPFDLYSNADGYTIPFVTNVTKAALLAGYSTSLVPNTATIVRVQSVGDCVNFINIPLVTVTTTTTAVPCGGAITSGGAGITSLTANLEASGGVLIFQITGRNVPDKFEIVHGGVKKSTSSMAVSPTNPGPFDNIYGDPVIPPSESSVSAIPQFIGANKGAVPTRKTEFDADNPGLGYITVTGAYQQLIWWKYTNADYIVNSNATLRVTGPSGGSTLWDAQRICPTTTTTTSGAPTTTTTTTVVANAFHFASGGTLDNAGACNQSPFPNILYSPSPVLAIGVQLFVSPVMITPFNGGGFKWREQVSATIWGINSSGIIISSFVCPP